MTTITSLSALSWPGRAACSGMDPELFFPVGTVADPDALAACASCPVRSQCLEYATATRQSGVWGGLTEEERAALKRRRSRVASRRGRDAA